MDVVVIRKVWGKYTEGDIIHDMPDSTALACIKAGAVKSVDSDTGEAEEPKKKVIKPKK